MPITHATCSALSDLGVAGEVGPDEWNTCHILDGGTNAQRVARDSAASGGFSWWDVFRKGADLVSGATLTLGTDGEVFHVTGTTGITAIASRGAGALAVLIFDGALTLTHNATTLILRDGVNYKTSAGDVLVFISEGSGNWREIFRLRGGVSAQHPAWTLSPLNAEFGACSNFPQLQKIEGTQSGIPYYVLDYDTATSESAYWSRMQVPTGFTVSRAALVLSVLSVASSDGTVGWLVNSQTVTCGGKWDVAFTTTDIFAAANPATCEGVLKQYRTTFVTNSTQWKEDSLIQIRIRRDLSDTLGSDARFLGASLSLSSST